VLPEEPEVTYPEDVFPELDNLDPDFEGNYAWSGEGTEEYVRFYRENDDTGYYLVKGSAWDKYDAAGQLVSDEPGISYDRDSNTLTLTDFSGYYLDVNLMGNGFTIELIGNNYVNQVVIWGYHYGGSVRFTGSGSLVINDHYAREDGGLILKAEDSESCIMVEDDVILEIYGSNGEQYMPAILVLESDMDPVLYHSPAVEVYAKSSATGSSGEGTMVREDDAFVITAPDGTVADYVHFAPKE